MVGRKRAYQNDRLHFLQHGFGKAFEANRPCVLTALALHREEHMAARDEQGLSSSAVRAPNVNGRFRTDLLWLHDSANLDDTAGRSVSGRSLMAAV